jgi:hypothetical protein
MLIKTAQSLLKFQQEIAVAVSFIIEFVMQTDLVFQVADWTWG